MIKFNGSENVEEMQKQMNLSFIHVNPSIALSLFLLLLLLSIGSLLSPAIT